MGKAHTLAPIERCVSKALQSFQHGDMHDAIYQIAPAIDVTAKRRYPTKLVGERIKSFIRDEQSLIYFLSTQGRLRVAAGVKVILVDRNTNRPVGDSREHGGELADFIYHNIRCAQSHDGEINHEYIDFGRVFGIGRQTFENDGGPLKPGTFVVSQATILALILSVVCAPENAALDLPGDIQLFGRALLKKELLVGSKDYLMELLEHLFCPTDGGT
jgi:hypothetical protein